MTAINCLKEIALQQMILTKKRYGKNDQYIAWHGYQSFSVDEIEPELAHEIGVKLAREMWGDRFQILVTTHLDKDHIHNHFCFNSVSFRDGKKYNYSKSEIQRLRDCSDRLCREYGLSVIENAGKSPGRPTWLDEKAGKPTRYNLYREDIETNGLWYKKQDEYFLPCIGVSQEQTMRTGIWGERHRQYLKKYRRIRYCNLLTSGQLNAYLADVNSQAEKLFFQLVNEFAQKENVTEKLKEEDAITWVQKMNNIRNRAMEIVNQEIIFA